MATTGTALMSWEEFEQLPDGDGIHRELIEGELQELPPAKSGHSRIATKVFLALLPLQQSGVGEVLIEAGFKLSARKSSWIQPDVSFVSKGRILSTAEDGYFLDPPDLAVEVVSPSETAPALQNKVDIMLERSCKAVWVIFPKTKTVKVHLPDGTSYTRSAGARLDAPFLDPDWSMAVDELFA